MPKVGCLDGCRKLSPEAKETMRCTKKRGVANVTDLTGFPYYSDRPTSGTAVTACAEE